MLFKDFRINIITGIFMLSIVAGYGAGYLKMGDIKGESTDKGHEEWIDILSYRFEVQTPTDITTGRPTGKRTYEPIIIRKRIDKATPILFDNLAKNVEVKEAVFEFTQPGGPTGGDIIVYRVTLGGVSTMGVRQYYPTIEGCPTENEGLNEEIHLLFKAIQLESVTGGTLGSDGLKKYSKQNDIPVKFFYEDNEFHFEMAGNQSFTTRLFNLSGKTRGLITSGFDRMKNFNAKSLNITPGTYFMEIKMQDGRIGTWPVTLK